MAGEASPCEAIAAEKVAGPVPVAALPLAPPPARRMIVVGSSAADAAPGEWRVLVLIEDGPAAIVPVALTPTEARIASRELTQMADLCEQGWQG